LPERAFICTPSNWLYDPGLNRVSERAELVFRRLAQCTDDKWRFSSDPAVVKSEAFSKRPSLRVTLIARCLDELRAAGAIAYHQSDGREWFEVSDHLRYQKGRSRWGFTVVGREGESPPDLQRELAIGPLCGVPEIPIEKTRKEKEKISSRGRARGLEPPNGFDQAIESTETRALCAEDQEEGDYLFSEIVRLCGTREGKENDALWHGNIRKHCGAVRLALEDLKANVRKVRSAGAYFNERFHAHRGDAAAARAL
jgi:hypothetical protein